jgi:hypothetical protein
MQQKMNWQQERNGNCRGTGREAAVAATGAPARKVKLLD